MGLAFALVVALVVALAAPAEARPVTAVIQRVADRARVDWTLGLVTASGVSAADLRAPDPTVARIRAERIARRRARAELGRALGTLSVAGGGTVEDRTGSDRVAAMRLERAIAGAEDHSVEYGSDGSVEVTVALPVESVRQAVDGLAGPSSAERPPVTAIVVDAGRALAAPQVGVALRVGDQRYTGPSVYHRGVKPAMTDARLGEHVERVRATAFEGGALLIDRGDTDAWRSAGPLIVIALRGGVK